MSGSVRPDDRGRGDPDRELAGLSALEVRLLDGFQRAFPLSATPFAEIAAEVGVDEATVIDTLAGLGERGHVSRIGPVFEVARVGASTLAAMAVPPERLDEVAGIVNGFTEVNHNYEREDAFNLWFVVTAATEARVGEVLAAISRASRLDVLDLPMEESYRIDLGFPLCG